MTPLKRRLLLVFGALGLGASIMSSYVHYKLLTDTTYTTFCDVNKAVSCTQAYLSPYGTLWGVPVALAGVGFFAIVLLLSGFAARPSSPARDSIASYIFALSTIALGIVLYLAWASYFQLHAICLFCATTYVAVLATFIISGLSMTLPLAGLPGRAGADVRGLVTTPRAIAILIVFVMGMALLIASFPREGVTSGVTSQEAAFPPLTDQQRADLEKWWAVQAKVDVRVPGAGAKVLVVKFSDYMCPACRLTYDWYKPVLGKYLATGEVHYIVKHYPLEAECNSHAPMNHYASCEAAAAVIMARAKGTAPKLEQWLFSNQPSLTPDTVKKAARDVGAVQDFDAQYQQALQEVRADADLGGALGVDSTPTFYINGRKLPGSTLTPPQYFDYLIELALRDGK